MRYALVIGTTAIASLSVGSIAGYLLARKQLELKYEEIAQQEIADAKRFYRKLHKTDEFDTPEKAAAVLIPETDNEFTESARQTPAVSALQTYSGEIAAETIARDRIKAGTEALNVFTQAEVKKGTPEEWALELRNRTEEAPYVISKAEYEENHEGYTQLEFTYYRGDQSLADDREDLVEDVDDLVGLYNLERFGDWSEDARVVYIRNDVRQVELTVLLHEGRYGEIVAGFTG